MFLFYNWLGILPQSTSLLQESSIVSASAPAISISTDRSESSAKKNEHQVQQAQVDRLSKKQNTGRGVIDAIQSPGSVRRSSRLVKSLDDMHCSLFAYIKVIQLGVIESY